MQMLASIAVQKKLTRRPTAGSSRLTVIVILQVFKRWPTTAIPSGSLSPFNL